MLFGNHDPDFIHGHFTQVTYESQLHVDEPNVFVDVK